MYQNTCLHIIRTSSSAGFFMETNKCLPFVQPSILRNSSNSRTRRLQQKYPCDKYISYNIRKFRDQEQCAPCYPRETLAVRVVSIKVRHGAEGMHNHNLTGAGWNTQTVPSPLPILLSSSLVNVALQPFLLHFVPLGTGAVRSSSSIMRCVGAGLGFGFSWSSFSLLIPRLKTSVSGATMGLSFS